MSDDVHEWLIRFVNSREFLGKYKLYAYVLALLDPIDDPFVKVMAVSRHDRRFYLHVNTEFFRRHPEFLPGVMLHEVHHIVLGHLTQDRFRAAAHPDLMELAMEISANEFIREPLPGRPVVWSDYREFGIRLMQSTRERYELLRRARERGSFVELSAVLDDHLPDGVAVAATGLAARDWGADVEAAQLIQRAAAEAEKHAATGQDSIGKLAGREPGSLIEELMSTESEPERFVDWKAAIQMFVALLRAPIHTYSRPNRRFPNRVGQVPGRMYYPREADTPNLLVAIDTSASMTTEELTEVARQLRPLSDLVNITIVECDVMIHRVYRFDGVLPNVAGRGGTDLRPVFEPEFLREHQPDGVIYFTDGCGPYPLEDPGTRTLWVLTKPDEFACQWGKKARLRDQTSTSTVLSEREAPAYVAP